MKLVLHIGTEKTGTTSFQAWMAKNRAALRAQGIFYPESLGAQRHIRLSLASHSTVDTDVIGFRNRKIASQADLLAFRDRTQKAFRAEHAQARSDKARLCVISDEGLQSRLARPDEVARVRDFLAPMFDSVEVMVSLRPQIDYAVSLLSTLSRLGHRIRSDWFDKVMPDDHRYNYDRLIGLWEGAFGPQALRILPYNRAPDTVALFTDLLGIKAGGFESVPRQNSFVDWRTIHVLNSLNKDELARFRPLIDTLGAKETLQIGQALAIAVTDRFQDSNARLCARRTDIDAADLAPDLTRYAKPENLSKLDTPIARADLPQAVFDAIFR